jgi:hypothetical protein
MFQTCMKLSNKIVPLIEIENDKTECQEPDKLELKLDEYLTTESNNSYIFATLMKNNFTVWTQNIKIYIDEKIKNDSYYTAILISLERANIYVVTGNEELTITTKSFYILDMLKNININKKDKKEKEKEKKINYLLRKFKKVIYTF